MQVGNYVKFKLKNGKESFGVISSINPTNLTVRLCNDTVQFLEKSDVEIISKDIVKQLCFITKMTPSKLSSCRCPVLGVF